MACEAILELPLRLNADTCGDRREARGRPVRVENVIEHRVTLPMSVTRGLRHPRALV
jgi:hypothetical protein